MQLSCERDTSITAPSGYRQSRATDVRTFLGERLCCRVYHVEGAVPSSSSLQLWIRCMTYPYDDKR
jgi:hypothetical protein